MKRAYLFSSLGVVGLVAATGAVWQSLDRVLPDRAQVGDVAVGKSTRQVAEDKLHAWWTLHQNDPVTVTYKGKPLAKVPMSKLGITLDEKATLDQVPESGPMIPAAPNSDATGNTDMRYPLVYVLKDPAPKVEAKTLAAEFEKRTPKATPAKVSYAGGKIVRKKEGVAKTVDAEALPGAALKILNAGKTSLEVPVTEASKRVSDEALAQIKDVVAQFSTNFSAGNRPRSSNIRLAASKINGTILLPGERFSFNGTVGRRTLKGGFQRAGVYINGMHDTGVGGGICQVSTTLYNAALLANLKIAQRSNHSLPVPYVPLGRDATVDYGNIDLGLVNSTDAPIVLISNYSPGRLTFRVLGKKTPGLAVQISSSRVRTSGGSGRTRRMVDRSLPAGASVVKAHGSPLRSCSTTRVVKIGGKVVKTEKLGSSSYGGNATVIAYNPAPRPRATPRKPAPPKSVPAEPAPPVAPAAPVDEAPADGEL